MMLVLRRRFAHVVAAFALISVLATAACGPLFRLPPVPKSEQSEITVLGLDNVRYWGDEVTPQMVADGIAS